MHVSVGARPPCRTEPDAAFSPMPCSLHICSLLPAGSGTRTEPIYVSRRWNQAHAGMHAPASTHPQCRTRRVWH